MCEEDLDVYFKKNIYQQSHLTPQDLIWVTKLNKNLKIAQTELKYNVPTHNQVLKDLKLQKSNNIGENYIKIKYNSTRLINTPTQNLRDMEKSIRGINQQFKSPMHRSPDLRSHSHSLSMSKVLATNRFVSLSILGKQ
ncbi:hypothetical protein SS50377_26465 [Spironucleus salmonicida]|uniref:Uncharacterized protein n=1 Tax=Spironucleus salmonicida TaxID=348837 RepID=A0A9P8RX11_9EUKA|nr:hypothetical protein SS50377_26465 [Spironucleus salmonicida]